MKTISTLLLAALFIPFGMMAQQFEGSIYFTKSNNTDVIKYAYHVKGDKVRIDEYEESADKVIGSMIVDLTKEELVALSHQRQLFMEREQKPAKSMKGSTEVIESGNKKMIMDRSCRQVRVKSAQADREITYWVADGGFDFFPKLLSILKRNDNFSTYYMSLESTGGQLPIHATERDLMRNQVATLAIDKIEQKEMAADLFVIPKGYYEVNQ